MTGPNTPTAEQPQRPPHMADMSNQNSTRLTTLPMPGDVIQPPDGKINVTVVASVYFIDDVPGEEVWMTLVLRPEAPFYEVVEIEQATGAWISHGTFPNIVPATAAYRENGGAY